MIYIGFALRNPWSQRFDTIINNAIAVTQNKTIEIAVYKNNCIFEFGFGITGFRQDHAGFNFDIGVFGCNFELIFCDNRHYSERTHATTG